MWGYEPGICCDFCRGDHPTAHCCAGGQAFFENFVKAQAAILKDRLKKAKVLVFRTADELKAMCEEVSRNFHKYGLPIVIINRNGFYALIVDEENVASYQEKDKSFNFLIADFKSEGDHYTIIF